MNFFHNKITNPAGGGITFADWLDKTFGKTASEAKPGTGLDMKDEPRGQQRGQVINNDNEEGAHSYQEGESVDGKKEQGGNARPDKGGKTDQNDNKQTDKKASTKTKQAHCGKEMGESKDTGKITEKHTEAGPGDDEHPEPKILINNDPNYQKGESTNPGKVKGDKKKQTGNKATKASFKPIVSMNRKEKLAVFAMLCAQKHPLAYCEAMVGIKEANMTDKEKKWFKKFWETQYPPEYVEEMAADR